jgi:hypothetical protein
MGLGAGQLVYASDLAGLRSGVFFKGANTTRNNTAALADDPDLSNIPLDPGFYAIAVHLYATNANQAAKFKVRWAFTGTWTSPMRAIQGPGNTNTSTDPFNVTPVSHRGVDASAQDATYSFGVSAAGVMMKEVADRVEILGTGNFSVQWAQVTATVANTVVLANSLVRVSKVDDL